MAVITMDRQVTTNEDKRDGRGDDRGNGDARLRSSGRWMESTTLGVERQTGERRGEQVVRGRECKLQGGGRSASHSAGLELSNFGRGPSQSSRSGHLHSHLAPRS